MQGAESASTPKLPAGPAIIVLSARDETRLEERARQLLHALETAPEHQLADIAYTLQVGREPMEQRLALLASSLQDLREKLGRFCTKAASRADLYVGNTTRRVPCAVQPGAALKQALSTWLVTGDYAKLLNLWAQGLSFDWTSLYGAAAIGVALPTYPFAKESTGSGSQTSVAM